jgi:hypothetical protein
MICNIDGCTAERGHQSTNAFRRFRKRLYHAQLEAIFEPLRVFMKKFDLTRFPDGHWRRAIYGIGLLLASVVSGWCPKCYALPKEFHEPGDPRYPEHTQCLCKLFDTQELWDGFGIIDDILVSVVHAVTSYILDTKAAHSPSHTHFLEPISTNSLHQISCIKVSKVPSKTIWSPGWRPTLHESTANKRVRRSWPILIEGQFSARMSLPLMFLLMLLHRIAAVPTYPGLRRFPVGRNFKQWTGNDSKALMKVSVFAFGCLVISG